MSRLRPALPYLALLGFTLFATLPLLRAQMLCTDDGFYHINKALVLEQVIRLGHPLARWMPHMAHGYGFPHFNYYAPLASYVLITLHSLGLIYPAAFHVFLVACVWLAGVGAYLLAREWFGPAAGLAAGVVYLTAPYLAFDIVVRGALAETFALIWPPFILYFLHRALARPVTSAAAIPPSPTRSGLASSIALGPSSLLSRWGLLAAVAFAALLYSHNTTALAAAPLAAGYVLLLALLRRDPKLLLRGGLLLALGLALSARFWLPALGERSLVQSDRLLVPPIFTYYTNYLTPGELLAPPVVVDPTRINASPAKGVGLVAALLALAGLAALLYRAYRRRSETGEQGDRPGTWALGFGSYLCLAFLGYCLLTLPVSRPVWDHVPLVEFIQFPWRLSGLAALCAALLAGAAVCWSPRRAAWLAGGIALVACLGHLSWWYARACEPFAEITLARTVQYEYDTFTIGTTAKGEFLPVSVHVFPDDNALADALRRGETPAYLTGLPQGARLSVTRTDPLDYRAVIETAAAFQLTFNQFYFPGWRAWLDDQPLPIQLTPDTGLITVHVPPGQHALRFAFGLTPLRAAGEAVSWGTLAALALASLWRRRRPRPAATAAAPPPALPVGLLLLGFGLLALRAGVIDRTSNPLRHPGFDGQTVAAATRPLRLDFAGGVNLYGYDLNAVRLPADGFVDASLYVSVREHVERRYWPNFHLIGPDGLDWLDPDFYPPRWHKEPPHTPYWSPEQYAQWARHLQPLPGTPPGEYLLQAEVFDLDSLQIASVLDEQGNLAAPRFALEILTLERPSLPFQLQPEMPAAHAFGPIALLGAGHLPESAQAGETLQLVLYWQSRQATAEALTARLELRGAEGRPAAGFDVPPVTAYPTSSWRPGDQWRGQHSLRLPADLPTGEYALVVGVPGQAGEQVVGRLAVSAPERIFERPAVSTASGAEFEGVGVLEGYTRERVADHLRVDLVWRALASPTLGYRVFVHLDDGRGRVWAQSDGVPAGWTRPTTGWVAGEYILDTHSLTLPADLPPGEYGLYVGLYDPQTSARVQTRGPGASPDNRVFIATLSLP